MATKKNVASKAETQAAQQLLKLLKADYKNVYLVMAVVAWMRAAGGLKAKGFNLFGLRTVTTERGDGSSTTRSVLNKYSSLAAAIRATAQALLKNRVEGADLILAALKRRPQGYKEQQKQALDFIAALALSQLDAGHFGVTDPRNAATSQNRIARLWTKITNIWQPPVTQPKQPPPPPPRPAEPPAPSLPDIVRRDYLDGYAPRRFYEARHTRSSQPAAFGAADLTAGRAKVSPS